MGGALAARLSKQGHLVSGYDVNPEKLERSSDFFFRKCKTLEDLITTTDYAVLCVYSGVQVLELLQCCPNSSALNRQLVFICTSTCNVSEIIEIDILLKSKGHQLIEMPISGSSKQFGADEALGLVACDPSVFRNNQKICVLISKKIRYLGHQCGDAAKAKLAINLVLGINRAAMAEGLAFARTVGLDVEMFFSTLRESSAYSHVMDIKGPLMVTRSFEHPQSRVDQSYKDFELMVNLAEKYGMYLPFANLYRELLARNIASGHGHLDNSIIIEAIENYSASPTNNS